MKSLLAPPTASDCVNDFETAKFRCGVQARLQTRSRTAFASQSRCWEYWSVCEINPRSAGLEAVSRVEEHPNRMPKLLADCFYLWETTVVQQSIETARISVSSGEHSLSCWSQ
jgi:hypothetical protein